MNGFTATVAVCGAFVLGVIVMALLELVFDLGVM